MLIPTAAGVVPNDQSTISGCLLQSYEDIGQAAFGGKGRAFITWVLYTELIGTCALFYILEVGARDGMRDGSKLGRGGHSWGALLALHSCRACSRPCMQRTVCGCRLPRPAVRPALPPVTHERKSLAAQQQPVASLWQASGNRLAHGCGRQSCCERSPNS